MDAFESLTNIFRKLLIDLRAGPHAGEPDEEPACRKFIGRMGKPLRQSGIGCPFEAS